MLRVKQFTQQFKAILSKAFAITIAIGFRVFACESALMLLFAMGSKWIAIQIRDNFAFMSWLQTIVILAFMFCLHFLESFVRFGILVKDSLFVNQNLSLKCQILNPTKFMHINPNNFAMRSYYVVYIRLIQGFSPLWFSPTGVFSTWVFLHWAFLHWDFLHRAFLRPPLVYLSTRVP